MLACRRTLEDPLTGRPIDLPMIVPAFTSKGFPTYKHKGKDRSDVAKALEGTRTYLRESILVSAYDIHYNYIPPPDLYFKDKVLAFLDSGGYELTPNWDSTEPKQGQYQGRPFREKEYRRVLASLPDRMPTVIVNYDWGSRKYELPNQILAAQRLFADFDRPSFLTSFILKPGQRSYLDLDGVLPHLEKLRHFKCIGVVEKELGENLLKRLVTVGRLRQALKERRMEIPIHVWGGLDPVTTPLYFFAGADIFDGVSWLRYAYHNGVAVCRESHCVLHADIGLGAAGNQANCMTLIRNITYLNRLKEKLCGFVNKGGRTFKMFDELCDGKGPKLSAVLKRAFDTLAAEVPSVEGGD